VGYFKDAFLRFKKNKSSLAAAVIIMILFLFAIIVPFVSDYDVTVRDGYYALMTPKSRLFAGLAPQTAERLGYLYRKDEEEGMLRYLRWLKAGGRGEP